MAVKSRSRHEVRGTNDEPDTRQKLIVAAIHTVERHGVDGATVRRIVAEAGVNIAAVNYHFGSKENLLQVALEATLHEAFTKALGELQAAITEARDDIPAGTARFLKEYLRWAFLYPRISVAHLRAALIDQDYSGGGVAALRKFVEGFGRIVEPAMPGSAEEKRLAVIHLWATIYELGMLPELFGGEPGQYSSDAMIRVLLGSLFGRCRVDGAG